MIFAESRLAENFHIILARRMATWVTLFYLFIFIGIFLGGFITWIDGAKPFLPQSSALTMTELYFLIGLLAVCIPIILSLCFQPQILDRELDLYDSTGDPLLDGKLKLLQQYTNIQYEIGHLRRRAKLYLSDEINMNALTYGGVLKPPRVVFAADLFRQFSDSELQGILCHELSHIHYGDYYVTVSFHFIMRLFDAVFWPVFFLFGIIRWLINLTFIIPIIGWLFRLVLYILWALLVLSLFPLYVGKGLYALQSHLREYIADAYAVCLLDDADGVLDSLMKLENAQIEIHQPPEDDEHQHRKGQKHKMEGSGSDADQKNGLNKKPKPLSGKFRRYATVIYEVENVEPETTLQRIYATVLRLNETHPPGELRWKRIARIGFQIENGKMEGAF